VTLTSTQSSKGWYSSVAAKAVLVVVVVALCGSARCQVSSNLDQEARIEFQKFLDKHFTRCENSRFSLGRFSETIFRGVSEYRDLTERVVFTGLTAADSMNGVQWRGEGLISWTFGRSCLVNYSLDGHWSPGTKWGEWADGQKNTRLAYLEKKNGNWTITASTGFQFYLDHTPLQCGAIKKYCDPSLYKPPPVASQRDQLGKQLIEAIGEGDIAVVRALLIKGADPNFIDERSQNPALHRAIYEDAAIVRLLLNKGANPNSSDRFGDSILNDAVFEARVSHKIDIVSVLLDSGANPNFVPNHGRGDTALMIAADSGRGDATTCLKLVRSLLAHKGNPRLKNNNGDSAIDYASKWYSQQDDPIHGEIVRLLQNAP
jgi:uncharacterized protein